jgi:hypothetical protein
MATTYNRRRFLKNSATWALAFPVLPVLTSGNSGLKAAGEPGGLEQTFLEPPDSAWPWVYWFVSDGNLTREGITADFEAMRRVGIRGALYMEVDQYVPKGAARFLSPQWREMIQHAVKEATRLGITLNMNNDGGWTGSGGPWITPELSMQVLVWSETRLQGPKQFTGVLPPPKTVENYYRDITVLAFPNPPGEGKRMADCSPRFTYGLDRQSIDAAPLTDGNTGTSTSLPRSQPGQPQYLNIDFPEPFAAKSLTVALDTIVFDNRLVFPAVEAALEVSDVGRNFRPIRSFTLRWPTCSVNFPEESARHFRIALTSQIPYAIPLAEVELHQDFRIEDIAGKAAFVREENFHGPDLVAGEPSIPPETVIRRDQIIDITSKMGSNGQLSWDVPEGKWTVLRIGHTSTGKMNHPAPKESLGLECDKLGKKAIEVQFSGLLDKLLADQAAVGGKALAMTHIDSWEVGSQNWTAGFREQFQQRFGYDLLPYLATLTGRAVESREVSERFLWDLRRLVADLLLENYAGHMQELCAQHGLTLSIEAYGVGPLDEVALGGRADVPMSEFWSGEGAGHPLTWNKEMASSGHLYGHPFIGAEAFTATSDDGRWQSHPYRMKPLGDLAFTQGINRFVFHRYSAQPWLNHVPGMTMGPHGVHYERTNTWWEQSRAWNTYLARCQALLQSGQFVADVACLGTQNAPSTFPDGKTMIPPMPAGYDFDNIPPEVLLEHMTVQDGRLVLPTGMSYKVMVLPPARTMTPALLQKIKELVVEGATIVGPPPATSPSLGDYPRCDDEVRQLAAELWGECDGVSITANRCGKGNVIWGRPLAEVLRELHTPPDFACPNVVAGDEIHYIHRNVDGAEVYFVASAVPEARKFLCTFRVKARQPELWWPDTGRTEAVAVYNEQEGNTTIPLNLDPYGSVFVVFRAPTGPAPDRIVSIRREGVEISGLASKPVSDIQLQQESLDILVGVAGDRRYRLESGKPGTYELKTATSRKLMAKVPALPPSFEIGGPWELQFPKGLGAPDRVILDRLTSWTDHTNPGVKYFSGTATYHRKFNLPADLLTKGQALYLDLGRVCVIAQAKLNGHDLGIWWKPPFRGEVTGILQAGANDLLVSVVNLWPNRLIGDEQLPDDCDWASPPQSGRGRYLRSYPQWLVENKPRPTARVAFTTWKHWTKDDPLMESGLLGPVRILARGRVLLS